jgi:transcriptional regulator with XRE-family HTH domain
MPPRIYPKRLPQIYIAEWRGKLGLTQQQLGDRLGVSDVTVSRWETKNRRPDNNTLAAICEGLGIHITAIYRHPDAPSADELLKDQPGEVWEQALAIIRTIRR